MLKVISTAALLSWAVFAQNFVSASTSVSTTSFAPVATEMALEAQMSKESERILIEVHATTKWGLSIAEAWDMYDTGDLEIVEIEEDYYYEVVNHAIGDYISVVLEE